jgi:DNA-binding SARP family transcriptional activator
MNFQVLGPLRVVDDEQREVALGGVKRAAVLALLLVHPNEVISADRLIEELWEGSPPPTAAKSLQVHISRLRRALGSNGDGGPIATTANGYMLQVDPECVDALRFERLVAEGRAALTEGNAALASSRLRCALELWRGDALADFAYASFAQEPVARLDGLRTVALEGAVEAELELGRHAELIPELKSLVRQYPLSERLRGQLMLALYRSGRQAEALGVYRAGRRILVDELGIEPGAELRELERAILAQDPGLDAPAPERERRRERAPGAPGGLLVGYEHELSALEDMLERALVGQGRVALLSGEPGVGKTRLADELSRVAQARGADVFWARCWSGGGTPAFWPWAQVLRALLADRDPAAVRAELGDKASDLAQLLPELGITAADAGDPQEARFRLFDAASAFIRRAALTSPLVLVFDDLHAADPATLALLGFIGSSCPDVPVLLLGTYRDTDVAGNDALGEALTELTRSSDCVQLVLTGLTGEDTAHFVELSSGVAPMGALAAAIWDVSSGNPLFVSELVRLLQSERRLNELGADDVLLLPRGIEQVIGRRLQQLSAEVRETLSLAAVIGTEFQQVVLERASASDPGALLDRLDKAETARVVERVDPARLRFSHDLVRQSLYGALKAGERSRAHLSVAEAIERLDPKAIPDLSHHYSQALPLGDAEKAVRYTTLAGDVAAELLGYEDAAGHYRRAIEIATARGVDPAELPELYIKLAEQCSRALDAPAAATALDQAEAAAGGELPPALHGRAELTRAEYDLFDVCASGRERVVEVIRLYEELGDLPGQARAWDGLHCWAYSHARLTEASEAAARTLELSRQVGNRELTERALRILGAGLAYGDFRASEAELQLRSLMDQSSNPATKGRFLIYLGVLEARRGRFDEMRVLIREAAEVLDDQEFLSGSAAGHTMRLELLAGNPARAELIARRSCDDLERRGLSSYLASEVVPFVEALIAQGKLDEAEVQLRRGEAVLVETDLDARHGQARAGAALHLARHEIDEAEAAAHAALRVLDEMQWPDLRIQTQLILARTLFEAGRTDEARDVAEAALEASEAIEHVVYAERARDLLGAPTLA